MFIQHSEPIQVSCSPHRPSAALLHMVGRSSARARRHLTAPPTLSIRGMILSIHFPTPGVPSRVCTPSCSSNCCRKIHYWVLMARQPPLSLSGFLVLLDDGGQPAQAGGARAIDILSQWEDRRDLRCRDTPTHGAVDLLNSREGA